MAMNSVTVKFDDALELKVQPDPAHEWLLTNEQVAEGYGVSVKTIQGHKLSHADELVSDKHFITSRNTRSNPRAGIPHELTLWTKRGVIRLGFFIRSERAKKFRDFCENLVLETLALPAPKPSRKPAPRIITIPPTPACAALEAMAAAGDTYGLLADSSIGEYPALYSHLVE
ncbi:MAG: ORF6N domain-containing protein, partial [Pleurocapsa sp. SU_196_0]|nr:ORF6N domain-containing protein [Pleurocapsa sp. SU_196_0]